MKFATVRRAIAVSLCAGLLLPLCALPAKADDGPKVIIEIGQPSIWSLGQAHYLLARMHKRNRGLRSQFPSEGDLDPNKIAATRIDALRSSLGIEGQFDESAAVKNDIALRRFREGEIRRERSRADLRARQAELQAVNSDLQTLNEQIAVLEEEDRQSTEARARATPPAPPTAEDNQRKKDLVTLRVRKARREEERTDLRQQITSLSTAVDTPTASPTLETPALTTGNAELPNPATFQKFMDKALAEAGKPDLTATMKLDNFVQMQYEIIAKQLTLLRDEVGPDDRVIFLELPASIYTVDKKADGYVAQAEWEVTGYFDKEPDEDIQAQVIIENLRNAGKSPAEIRETLLRISNVRNYAIEYEKQARRQDYEEAQKQFWALKERLTKGVSSEAERKEIVEEEEKLERQRKSIDTVREDIRDKSKYGTPSPYPITLEMVTRQQQRDGRTQGKPTDQLAYNYGGEAQPCAGGDPDRRRVEAPQGPCKLNVRAIDIIPRQSALNVNESHATVKQTMILAAFKFLIGFAGKVSYQRQRELYEQFVQQETFASGYGKGDNLFGWTYGPQPGTKRIKTGQRTSFAVLVVPRNTLAIELKGRGRYYKRHESPTDRDDDVKRTPDVRYVLGVPGQRTQEFWVDSINYTPVRKGRRVTAVVEGDFFSPQLGVLVNGVPLEPTLSVARVSGEAESEPGAGAEGVRGEFEINNSRQITLSFSMGDNYVGTPTVTFVTPEKTAALNFFNLKVNNARTYTSLQEQSVREPMFIEDFADKLELEELRDVEFKDEEGKDRKFKLVRVKGQGLRPGAEILLNNRPLAEKRPFDSLSALLSHIGGSRRTDQFAFQDSTKSYVLYFEDGGEKKWDIRYRQLTRQGYEEGAAGKDRTSPEFDKRVTHYRFNPAARGAEVNLTFLSKGKAVSRVDLDDLPRGLCRAPLPLGDNLYRVKCFVPADNGGRLERDFITAKVTLGDGYEKTEKFVDITLPVRPLLTGVINPRTGRAEGFAEEQPTVVITGINLQGVTSVIFGDKETPVSAATPDAITVKVPKGPSVPKGQAVAVPIILKTAGESVPGGAVYTYQGEPLPPNYIVWPPPPGGRAP